MSKQDSSERTAKEMADACATAIGKLLVFVGEFHGPMPDRMKRWKPDAKTRELLESVVSSVDALWTHLSTIQRDEDIALGAKILEDFYRDHGISQGVSDEAMEYLKGEFFAWFEYLLTPGQLGMLVAPPNKDVPADMGGPKERAAYRIGRLHGLTSRTVFSKLRSRPDKSRGLLANYWTESAVRGVRIDPIAQYQAIRFVARDVMVCEPGEFRERLDYLERHWGEMFGEL